MSKTRQDCYCGACDCQFSVELATPDTGVCEVAGSIRHRHLALNPECAEKNGIMRIRARNCGQREWTRMIQQNRRKSPVVTK